MPCSSFSFILLLRLRHLLQSSNENRLIDMLTICECVGNRRQYPQAVRPRERLLPTRQVELDQAGVDDAQNTLWGQFAVPSQRLCELIAHLRADVPQGLDRLHVLQ